MTNFRKLNALAKDELLAGLPALPKDELIEMLKGYINSWDELNLFVIESGLHGEFKEHNKKLTISQNKTQTHESTSTNRNHGTRRAERIELNNH
jgi:hypothetical protein